MKPFEFLGPYRLHATIGRGGMGRVYRAEHVQSGEPVAVKLIADNVADEPRFRRRFRDEVETLQLLKHPNIVRLIGYGEEQGHLFYSMELVEGESLQGKLRREKRLTWAFVLDLAIDICRGLKHAHDFGVIHRDLKPANLLIDREGNLKIVDFGIVKLFGNTEQTLAGSVLGTADYMAPEQAGDGPITPRTDLYGLGNVLYACFAGRPPFVHRSVTRLIESLRNDEPRRIEELNPDVPLEVAELIHDLLSKRPEERPPTALAVMNRLMAIREGMKRTMSGQVGTLLSGPAAVSPAVPAKPTPQRLGPADTGLAEEDDKTLGAMDADGPAGQHPSLSERITVALQPTLPTPADEAATPVRLNKPATVGFGAAPAESQFSRAIVDLSQAESDTPTEPRTHFRTVLESDRARGKFETAADEHAHAHRGIGQWLSLAGMIGILLIGLVAFLWSSRLPDNNELYAAIEAASQADDMAQVRQLGDQFLRLYASDPRAVDVKALQADGNIDRIILRLRIAANNVNRVDDMAAEELAFLAAVADRKHDPETTRQRLGQWLDLYAPVVPVAPASEGSPSNTPSAVQDPGVQVPSVELVIAAQKEFQRLASLPTAAVDPRAKELLERIRWSEQTLDQAQRQRLLRAIVSLFADKPWARPAVAEATRLLAATGG